MGILRPLHLTPADIKLGQTGFYLEGVHYPFDNVESLRYYDARVERALPFPAEAEEEEIKLDIYLLGFERPISIETESVLGLIKMFCAGGPVLRLAGLYKEIARHTYPIRRHRYFEEFEKQGYIYYGGKQIFKTGVVSDGERTIDLFTDRPLVKSEFSLSYRAPTPGGGIKGWLSRQRKFVIKTEVDSDVFFSILEQYFHLRW